MRAQLWRKPVRALALALFDRGRGIPEERLEWALDDLASFLAHAGPRTTFLFTVTALVLEWCPIFIRGRLARLSSLDAEARGAYLEACDRTRLAIVLVLPKALLSLVYYEHPDALAETGYDGHCLMGQLPEGVGLVELARARARALARAETEPHPAPVASSSPGAHP